MKLQKLCQGSLQIFPFHDFVHKSMLQEKFCSLEAFGKLLANCLLDHSWTCKSDQGSRLRQYHISQHGKAGCNASRSRLGQNRNIKKSRVTVLFQCCRSFDICIREVIPSCILAPPEQAKRITGSCSRVARSTALVIFRLQPIPYLP